MRRFHPRIMVQLWLSCLLMFLVLAPDAHAYIDPGSGALLWQMAVAGFMGVLFYFRQFFKRSHARKENVLDDKKTQES
jgi:hypothetical protein